MGSIEGVQIDLKELEEDRRRNQEDRFRMLDDYAEWLRKRGVLTVGPARSSQAPGPRPAKRRTRTKKPG